MQPKDIFPAELSGKILVIGDAILDRYIHGRVMRISPEAPVPVFHHQKMVQTVGGAANVAANIAALGGEATLVGAVGDDTRRNSLSELLAAYNVSFRDMVSLPDHSTTTKTRFVCNNQQIMRYDEEESQNLSQESIKYIKNKILPYIPYADVIVISDYGKGLVTKDLSFEIIQQAKKYKKVVIVDPKGKDYTKYNGATAITPNLQELSLTVNKTLDTDEKIYEACRDLIDAHGLDFVLATRSAQGMSLVSKKDAINIPTYAQEVYDVSGAGDTVVAAFAVCIASGMGRRDAAYVANAAAGIAVSKRGTARVSGWEVKKELIQNNIFSASVSISSDLNETIATVTRWKKDGYTVGFTNGCFDILHYGHVSILERAKSLCDRLVVGVNSDASVRRLKGAQRPVNAAQDRAAIINALRVVDAVVVFDDDTPLSLIKELCPDILFKGADYTMENFVGKEFVQKNGGKVILLDLEGAHSTTRLIKKITHPKGGVKCDDA